MPLYGQEEIPKVVDSLYREDQIYAGVTFNLLTNGPVDFSQNGLSAGLQLGFIRDFPINKSRSKSIGVGVGFALDTYNQNLRIGIEEGGINTSFEVTPRSVDVTTNRFTTYSVEFPIEYRWRTSTPTKYAFWRVHLGAKLGYIFSFQSTYEDSNESIVLKDTSLLNTIQYGPAFSFGYGAFNFQGYYGLNTLFADTARADGEEVGLQVIRLGLVFYFL